MIYICMQICQAVLRNWSETTIPMLVSPICSRVNLTEIIRNHALILYRPFDILFELQCFYPEGNYCQFCVL